MPIGKASYGQLGSWGRKGKRISRKKILIISVLLIFSLIFSISNNSIFPIPRVFGDYNTSFSHTRTPIFTDTAFTGPSTGAVTFRGETFACGGGVTSLTLPGLAGYTSGDNSIVVILGVGVFNGFVISDSMGLTYTERVFQLTGLGGGASSYIFTSTSSGSGNNVVTITTGGASRIFCAEEMDYSNIQGFGNTGTSQNDNANSASGSSSVTITFSSGSTGIDVLAGTSFTAPNPTFAAPSQTQRDQQTGSNPIWIIADKASLSGSTTLTLSWSGGGVGTGASVSMSGLEFKGASGVTNFQKVRWNYNTTCVSTGGLITFDYSKGVSGGTGNNCSSADIAISKSPANLQVAAGRMLEIALGWNNAASTTPLNVTFVLRTNATLPIFNESYNPFRDIQARLVWAMCPAFASCNGQTIYVARDQSKSIFTETLPNDLVIQGGQPFFNATNIPFENQAVLNFTGPTNFMGSFTGSQTTSASNNTASSLQFGQDYYILIMATFNTALSPCGSCTIGFDSIQTVPGSSPLRSFGIFSVPSSCTDQINKTPCSLPTAQPVFQFNPLDPSTWGNAIIKGFLWVFSVALPQALVVTASVLVVAIRAAGNFIGGFFGQGNLGDNMANFLNGIGSLLLQAGTVFGWLSNIITSPITMISILVQFVSTYFPGLTNFLSDTSNSAPLLVLFPIQVGIWFPNSYMIIMIAFYFLLVMMNGLKGFFEWIHLVKWSAFHLWNVFMRFLKGILDGITWVLGRISIISPGHKLTAFPHFEPGPLPRIEFTRDMALFHDPIAWFLSAVGFFFTILYAATSASGLPLSTRNALSAMQGLTLTMFGIFFMVLILVLPGWLLGKMYEKGIVDV